MLSTTQSRVIQMFSDLSFDNQKHLYYWKGVRVPYSVTGLIKKFIPPFNELKILPLSAAKVSKAENREVTVHELKRRWQLINTTACELGTRTHNFLEHYTGLETPTSPQEIAGVKYIKDLKGQYEISFRELRAYSEKYGYAGTMDIPLKVVGKEEYVIDDYKTTGDLFKAYDYMFNPFSYLESSAYNHYQLQLSYYKIMLEDIGMKIVGTRLVHLMADGEYRIYPLYDFSKELRKYHEIGVAA